MDNDTIPTEVEGETTVPVPAETMREVVARRRPWIDPSLIDGLNGVDERGGW